MKSSLLITLFFTLLLVCGMNAIPFTPAERDVKNYEACEDVAKNIAFNGERKLDVYYDKTRLENKRKVVIHIYGGSWIIGDKIGQTKIGQLINEKGSVAVVPNYVLFPEGTIEDMVDDVYQAIQWTYKNISKYGGNPKKITLCAHSAGAHLAALTLVKSTLGLSNNGKELEKLPKIEKVILLDGPYAFDQEFIAYTLQGASAAAPANPGAAPNPAVVEQQLALQKLMMTYMGKDDISPVALLKKQEKGSVKFDVGKFVFFYVSNDTVIPESSSKNLISEISRTTKNSFEYIYKEGLGHATLTDGVRAGEEKYNEMYIKIIKS